MPGRIETYIHSDSVSSNKGGAIVKITCETDFLANTEVFAYFCKRVAKMAYGVSIGKGSIISWNDIIETFPALVHDLEVLQIDTKEKIELQTALVLKVVDDKEPKIVEDNTVTCAPVSGSLGFGEFDLKSYEISSGGGFDSILQT